MRGASKELKVVEGHFVEVCRRRGLKVSANKSKVIVLNGEKKFECKICVDGER